MKTNTGVNPTSNKAATHNHRSENKNNLDSRKNEEFDFKGDNVTHNTKETKAEKEKKKED